MYCPQTTKNSKIIWARCILLHLRSMTLQRAPLLLLNYLDLLLSTLRDGQLHTSIYDKRDDLNFHITNFPFPSSNIPSSPAYGFFISQLIRYVRDCSSYECFVLRARRLSSKLLKKGYLVEHSGSFMVDTGILFSNEVSLSRMLPQKWFKCCHFFTCTSLHR